MRDLGRRTTLLLLIGLVPFPLGASPGATGDGPSASRWIAQLEDADAARRVEAARALGRSPKAEEGVAEALERALDDEDRAVRAHAAIALVGLGERLKTALPVLMAARRDTDETVRAEAEAAWKQRGSGYRAALLYLESPAGANAVGRNSQAILEELARAGLKAVPAVLDSLAHERPGRNFVSVISEYPALDDALVVLNAGIGQANNFQGRKILVETLGRIGPDAVPTLVEALRERQPALREAAAEALGQIGPDASEAVSRLIQALDDSDGAVRIRAVQAISKVGTGSDEAARALIGALENKDTVVRRGSAVALSKIRPLPETVAEAFRASLEDPDLVVRLKSAEALSALDPPEAGALRVLAALLENRIAIVAGLAQRWLEALGPKAAQAAPELRETLREAEPVARVRAALVLATLGTEDRETALAVLEDMAASSDDAYVRLSAAEALLGLGRADDAVPVLVALLGTTDNNLDKQVEQIFRRLGPKAAGAVPSLVEALEQGTDSLRAQILSILQELGPPAKDAAPAIVRLVGSADENVRNYALNILSQVPKLPDEAAPALLEAIDGFDARSQGRAVSLLSKFGPNVKGVVPALSKLLENGSQPAIRQQVAQALRQLVSRGSEEAVEVLVGAIDDPDASVRTQAIQALTQIGPVHGPVVPVLVDLLEYGDPVARVQALQALRNISPADLDLVIPALAALLRDPKSKLADQAVQFLSSHGRHAARAGVQALVPLLKGEDPGARAKALTWLRTLTVSEPAEIRPARGALLDLADGPVQSERLLALQLIVQRRLLEGDRARAVLEKALEDDDPAVRIEAADGLSVLSASAGEPLPGLVPALFGLIDQSEIRFRLRAVAALERLGPTVEGALPRLLAHQDDPDAEVRCRVAQVLLRMGPEGRSAAVPMIARGLSESNRNGWFRWSSLVSRLGPLEKQTLVPVLVARLDGPSSPETHQAVYLLLTVGPAAKPAVPALVRLLETARDSQMSQVLEILTRLGTEAEKAATETLSRRLGSSNVDDKIEAARMLRTIDPRPGGPADRALVALLEDPASRDKAVNIVGELKRPVPEARATLLEMLGDSRPHTRMMAARALLATSPEDSATARKALADLLDEIQPPSNRSFAVQLLADTGEEGLRAALPVLIEMLGSSDIQDLQRAVTLLNRPYLRGCTEAVPALVGILESPFVHLRGHAASALSYIGGPEARSALSAMAKSFAETPPSNRDPSFVDALARFGPDGLPPLVEALGQPDRPDLSRIISAVGSLGPEAAPAAPALVRIATERDEAETAEARRVLLQIGPKAVLALAETLGSNNPDVRRRAASLLGEFGPVAKPATRALKALLDDSDPDVRTASASALMAVGTDSDALLPVLASGLSEGSPEGRETAARALAKASPLPEEYAEALERAVEKGDGLTRVFAAEALGLVRGEDQGRLDRAVSVLSSSMAVPSLQSAVIDAVESFGPKAEAAIPSLADYLRSGADTTNLIRAAYALAAIGRAGAVEVLTDLLGEIDPRFRPLLVEAIAKTGPEAPEALVRQLGHDDPAVRSMAVRHLGLKVRGGSDGREALVKALDDPAVEVRAAAVQAIGHLGKRARDLAPRMAGLLDSADPTLRAESAIALSLIEGRVSNATRPVLISSATDGSFPGRWRALERFGEAGEEAVPALISGLKADDYSRLAASESLARIGPEAKDAVPALLSALDSRMPVVRARAALALVAVGGPAGSARPVLVESLKSPELDPRLHGHSVPVHLLGHSPTRQFGGGFKMTLYLMTHYPDADARFIPVVNLVALRREMVEALGNMGGDAADALPVVSAIADGPDEHEAIREAADEARRRIGPAKGRGG